MVERTLAGPPTAVANATPPHGVHARRVIFIDLARALAVVFMIYGHSVDALLAPQYRVGTWFNVWQFQRGLTSCLFLLLSGFAFSIATARHWTTHLSLSRAYVKRTRRFALFVLLGYSLHFPVDRFALLMAAGPERWRTFLAVDVLQLIGMTFLLVQMLVLVARTRLAFMLAAFAAAIAVVIFTPAIWSIDWAARLPLWIAAYFAPSTGSQFPLFPWAAYVLLGAALGQIYARWGAAHLRRYANLVLLVPGIALIAAGLTIPSAVFGTSDANWLPPQVMLRMGSCLAGLAVIAHGSAFLTRLPHIFGAVAQETLLIYFVHLCIVYGSIWNKGLAQVYGPTLGPAGTVTTVVLVLGSMVLLAWYWNWQKHVRPRTARWISFGAGALLTYALV